MTDSPIVVNSNPVPAILMGVARSALIAAGGVLVQKGYVDDQQLSTLVGGLLSIGGIAWVAFLNYRNTRTKTVIAEAAPNTVAVVK